MMYNRVYRVSRKELTVSMKTNHYHWYCHQTGEICATLRDVLRVIWENFKYYNVLTLRWSYNKKGW